MNSFVHSSYSARHSGATRVDSANDAVSKRRGFDGTKGLSAMLLAAMVAALVVVADQLIDTWADGHLLAAWVALWLVGFAALAIFAGAARKLAMAFNNVLNEWIEEAKRVNADRQLWAIAQMDSRVMADLIAAKTRFER